MPPRVSGAQRLGTFSLCIRPAPTSAARPSLLPMTQTASISQKEKRRMVKQDPYRWAQMERRKAVHNERRAVIEAARDAQKGDPVRGIRTPFVESFDSAGQASQTTPPLDNSGNPVEEPRELPTSPEILKYMLHRRELDAAIENAYTLTRPIESTVRDNIDPIVEEESRKRHEELHAKAVEALNRITSMDKASGKDRRHANIRRCVDTFGRHETDKFLRPRPLSRGQVPQEKPVRGGPDTGSSEVQIAILTAKIRGLANALEINRGYKDKVGKRDLRLMVHRRQRLLQYMERKERGSDRWKNMIEKLGLGTATYKGQISL